jgi:hypothetical protein
MKKLLCLCVLFVVLFSPAVSVSADGGDDLVSTLLEVDNALTRAARRSYRFSAQTRTCKNAFLAFTKDGEQLPASCTTRLQPKVVAQQFCAINVKRGALVAPRGWESAEITAFCEWAVTE